MAMNRAAMAALIREAKDVEDQIRRLQSELRQHKDDLSDEGDARIERLLRALENKKKVLRWEQQVRNKVLDEHETLRTAQRHFRSSGHVPGPSCRFPPGYPGPVFRKIERDIERAEAQVHKHQKAYPDVYPWARGQSKGESIRKVGDPCVPCVYDELNEIFAEPTADIVVSPEHLCEGGDVQMRLENLEHSRPIVLTQWDLIFPDGTPADSHAEMGYAKYSPYHNVSMQGDYEVRVLLMDNYGRGGIIRKSFSVCGSNHRSDCCEVSEAESVATRRTLRRLRRLANRDASATPPAWAGANPVSSRVLAHFLDGSGAHMPISRRTRRDIVQGIPRLHERVLSAAQYEAKGELVAALKKRKRKAKSKKKGKRKRMEGAARLGKPLKFEYLVSIPLDAELVPQSLRDELDWILIQGRVVARVSVQAQEVRSSWLEGRTFNLRFLKLELYIEDNFDLLLDGGVSGILPEVSGDQLPLGDGLKRPTVFSVDRLREVEAACCASYFQRSSGTWILDATAVPEKLSTLIVPVELPAGVNWPSNTWKTIEEVARDVGDFLTRYKDEISGSGELIEGSVGVLLKALKPLEVYITVVQRTVVIQEVVSTVDVTLLHIPYGPGGARALLQVAKRHTWIRQLVRRSTRIELSVLPRRLVDVPTSYMPSSMELVLTVGFTTAAELLAKDPDWTTFHRRVALAVGETAFSNAASIVATRFLFAKLGARVIGAASVRGLLLATTVTIGSTALAPALLVVGANVVIGYLASVAVGKASEVLKDRTALGEWVEGKAKQADAGQFATEVLPPPDFDPLADPEATDRLVGTWTVEYTNRREMREWMQEIIGGDVSRRTEIEQRVANGALAVPGPAS